MSASENIAAAADDVGSVPERITVQPKGVDAAGNSSKSSIDERHHAEPALVDQPKNEATVTVAEGDDNAAPVVVSRRAMWFAYLKTRHFWIVLVLTQTITLAQTGTSTFTQLLANEGTSLPAFQTFFNYVALNVVYTGWTLYKYGFKGWCRMVWAEGWKYVILAFFDVNGNYFVVLGYDYTTILSGQLIGFWTLVVVVLLSLIFLKVRYHIAQYAGILTCCAGFGVLIASDWVTGSDSGVATAAVKGDLFVLVSATCYGVSNVLEEYLVSKKPMYEVIGQLAFWGMLINGVEAAIFNRQSWRDAKWDADVYAWIAGYTILLFFFYSAAPIVFRMSSAAFFNIGLLTGSFWTVAVGVTIFQYTIHWMYPIAFVLIIVGHFVYYGTEGVLGEGAKPWLGANQEGGSNGVGTLKRRLERSNMVIAEDTVPESETTQA